MYIKGLFLIICGIHLHAALHNSHRFPSDACDQHSRLEPSSDSHLVHLFPVRNLSESVVLKTTPSQDEEPACDQTVEAKIAALSLERRDLQKALDTLKLQKELGTLRDKQMEDQEELSRDISELDLLITEARETDDLDEGLRLRDQIIERQKHCLDYHRARQNDLDIERTAILKKIADAKMIDGQ